MDNTASEPFDIEAFTRRSLTKSLQSTPKCIPHWYVYDRTGSELFERVQRESPDYYYHRSEQEVFSNNVEEAFKLVTTPCSLIDLGSGNAHKTRALIDVILQHQSRLTYFPVDLSKDYLQESCAKLGKDYGDKLDIRMEPVDYDTAIPKIGHIPGNKIVLWLGSLQNTSYEDHLRRFKMLSEQLTDEDIVMVTVDITQDKMQIESAYNDPSGQTKECFLNVFTRLNKEYGSAINTGDFELEVEFIPSGPDTFPPGRLVVRARCLKTQTIDIPGLGFSIDLREGESINLFDGEAMSFKYTKEQLETIARLGGLQLVKAFTSTNQNVIFCCFKRRPKRLNYPPRMIFH